MDIIRCFISFILVTGSCYGMAGVIEKVSLDKSGAATYDNPITETIILAVVDIIVVDIRNCRTYLCRVESECV